MKRINLFWSVIGFTLFGKFLERLGQYVFSSRNNSAMDIFFGNLLLVQISFLVFLAVSLYLLFSKVFEIKKQSIYLLIPPLAYFLKEVYNLIFVFKFNFTIGVIIALTLEPLFLYGMIYIFNKYVFKIK